MSRVGIIVEGGLLAADLVERIALSDETVAGQKPKDFRLESGRLSAEIQAAFSDLRPSWDGFKRRREFSQTSPVTVTREAWIYPLFERLGYTLYFQRAALQVGGQSFPISHRIGEAENATPIHAVAFGQRLDERGEQKRSPHALLQEYLNKSDALWGIVTNGRELRLLRNSARSSRPSYIAIDLETVLDGNLYNEFALVFRLLHRSRLPMDGGDPHECLLETWYQQGIDEGGRVRDRLRDGVKAALDTLGSGFLAHPSNIKLRARIDGGDLTDLHLYRELLNLIYRLLFLMVAEERRLLFTPEAATVARHEIYLRWYGIGRLRDRAERRPTDHDHGDLWEGLKETFRLFRDEAAAKALALTALNGELFGLDACFDLEDRNTALRNTDLLDAIRQLSTFEERTGRKKTGMQRRVNYAGLDVEELGSIYESLLDYHPQVLRDPWRFALAAGSQRKETGSYYTPPELVRELIESALVPVMEARRDAAKTKEEKERALLTLTICDPAAGSGHFLLAAARRVGRELAIIRSREAEPAPETYRAALRDVIRHCLYAVDKNPLAVDLCKVALWIEGHSPGLPLSFLDHRIRCGDSLVGVFDLDVLKAGLPDGAFKRLAGDDQAVCAELRRINRRDRGGELAKFSAEAILAELAGEFAALADMPDETPGDVRSKEELYRQVKESERVARLRNACDAWTAAFFAPRGTGQNRTAPTTSDVWKALNGQPNHQRDAIIDELSEHLRFFHWRLEFPEVFARGGFDVMLGNPPWERIKLQEKEFFAARDHDIATAPNKAAREQLIQRLLSLEATAAQSTLAQAFVSAKRAADAGGVFARASGRFPLTAVGDANTYALFAELFSRTIAGSRSLLSRAGFIVPTGIATDATTSNFFGWLSGDRRLVQLLDFQSGGGFFDNIGHARFKFTLMTVGGHGAAEDGRARLAFFLRRMSDFTQSERFFELSADEIALINPNTKTLPTFRSRADAELTKRIYERIPVLIDEEKKGAASNPWGIRFLTMFHMANDSGLFRTARQLERDGAERDRADWIGNDERWLPLYEAKMVHHYDHRWATYDTDNVGDDDARPPSPVEKADSGYAVSPRYWVSGREVSLRTADLPKGLLDALRQRSKSLIAFGIAALLFAHWLVRNGITVSSDEPRGVYPLWLSFIKRHPFAHAIAPTRLGAVGDSPPSLTPETDDYLPAEPVEEMKLGPREVTAWFAVDANALGAYLGFSGRYQHLVEPASPLWSEDEAVEFAEQCLRLATPRWFTGWRDITNAGNERTVIASAIPGVGANHKFPLFFTPQSANLVAALLASWLSLPFDYVVRQKLGGTSLTYFYLRQFPVLPPSIYGQAELDFIVTRVLELTYTANDMHPFAEDLGYNGPPFPWDPDRRGVLKAELDAYFAYLYGLSRDELRYILDPKEVMGADYPSETFRVLKENEIRAYGEYRTRRLVLEAWDRFAENGTFDPARLRDPTHFDAVQRALVEMRGRVKSLERELEELLARSDETPLPTLFLEGESDVAILTAAWQAFYPTEPLPVAILAAGGTRQMESLAGKGSALRQLLGDRLVFALADNDREGRALVEDGRTRQGGIWRQQSNGIHWCLLPPTAEFEQAMRRFRIDAAYWPFTIENAFPAALRRQAIADGAYTVEEGRVQSAFLEEPSTAVKALDAVRDLDRTGDDAALYFRPPDPETKLALAGWIAAPERRDRAIFAAFGPILEGLRAILAERPRKDSRGSAAAK
jgi:hypothetical protein